MLTSSLVGFLTGALGLLLKTYAFALACVCFLLGRPPTGPEVNVVEAIAMVAVSSGETLHADREDATGLERDVALLSAIAYRESRVQNDVIGDGGDSVCAFQIYKGARSLLTDPLACATRARAMLRESIRRCRAHPVAIYARGRCDSADGRALSRDRVSLGEKVLEAALRSVGAKE